MKNLLIGFLMGLAIVFLPLIILVLAGIGAAFVAFWIWKLFYKRKGSKDAEVQD